MYGGHSGGGSGEDGWIRVYSCTPSNLVIKECLEAQVMVTGGNNSSSPNDGPARRAALVSGCAYIVNEDGTHDRSGRRLTKLSDATIQMICSDKNWPMDNAKRKTVYEDPGIRRTRSELLDNIVFSNLPLYWEHDPSNVIGVIVQGSIEPGTNPKKELIITAEIREPAIVEAIKVNGTLKGQEFSIGYDVSYDPKTFEITRWKVDEISLVQKGFWDTKVRLFGSEKAVVAAPPVIVVTATKSPMEQQTEEWIRVLAGGSISNEVIIPQSSAFVPISTNGDNKKTTIYADPIDGSLTSKASFGGQVQQSTTMQQEPQQVTAPTTPGNTAAAAIPTPLQQDGAAIATNLQPQQQQQPQQDTRIRQSKQELNDRLAEREAKLAEKEAELEASAKWRETYGKDIEQLEQQRIAKDLKIAESFLGLTDVDMDESTKQAAGQFAEVIKAMRGDPEYAGLMSSIEERSAKQAATQQQQGSDPMLNGKGFNNNNNHTNQSNGMEAFQEMFQQQQAQIAQLQQQLQSNQQQQQQDKTSVKRPNTNEQPNSFVTGNFSASAASKLLGKTQKTSYGSSPQQATQNTFQPPASQQQHQQQPVASVQGSSNNNNNSGEHQILLTASVAAYFGTHIRSTGAEGAPLMEEPPNNTLMLRASNNPREDKFAYLKKAYTAGTFDPNQTVASYTHVMDLGRSFAASNVNGNLQITASNNAVDVQDYFGSDVAKKAAEMSQLPYFALQRKTPAAMLAIACAAQNVHTVLNWRDRDETIGAQ